MDLHEIEYFITIIEEKSFSRAATKLYMAQPSLSNFLVRLEKKLGVDLIIRGKHSVTPTQFGKLYYEAGKDILERRDRLYSDIAELKSAQTDNIRLGSNSERTIRYISRLLPELKKEFPQTSIIIREDTEPELIHEVQSNELDICIVATRKDYLDIIRTPISNEEICVALTESHPLYADALPYGSENPPRYPINVFKDDSFILLKKNTVLRDITDQYMEKADFTPNFAMDTPTIRTALLLLSGGVGTATLCPKCYDATFSKLRYIFLENPPYYSVSICRRVGSTPGKSLKRLLQLIEEHKDTY